MEQNDAAEAGDNHLCMFLDYSCGGSPGMEMYHVSEIRRPAQPIDSAGLNSQITSPNPEQSEVMYNEGVPEFVVDQNLYYPAATNYGYYGTGFESPGEWEDQNRFFGLDAPEIQFAGLQNENMPYVYYTHSYGYPQSPYNPYNPYIPGAMVGVEGQIVGAQQYYTVPPHQNPVSSPAYVPLIVQPDTNPSNPTDYLVDVPSVNRHDGRSQKHTFAPASVPFSRSSLKVAAPQTSSLDKMSEGTRANTSGKQPFTNGSVAAAGYLNSTSSSALQDAGSKFRSKYHVNKALGDVKGTSDALFEQNRGPRTSRLKNQLMVKAYTAKTVDANTQGNIIIDDGQYNRDDFFIDYKDAKFFVIKSYSEDDVHKSIKYTVWSSTTHGNKKLDCAYADVQRIGGGKSGGCPIFLFFSVNASGQFCGVAEMVGPVDFNKDMDFWQQDKWSGSFRVKWHIIKDVSNTSFRHIILENNENKPVTNSRDTQEILFKKGLEILKIFKAHPLKTSILDDFMYYENRQKIMQEEKTQLLARSYERPVFVPAVDSRKIGFVELPSLIDGEVANHDANSLRQISVPAGDEISSNSVGPGMKLKNERTETVSVDRDNYLSTLKIGTLTINPRQGESNLPAVTSVEAANTESSEILTVGSMPVKVNGLSRPSGILKFGTIPLDQTVLHSVNANASKNGS